MKRILWMIFILFLLFSVTCFAQEKATVVSSDESKANIEKVGKKISEMPQARVKHVEKNATTEKQQNREQGSRESSEVEKVQKKASVKKNVDKSRKAKTTAPQRND